MAVQKLCKLSLDVVSGALGDFYPPAKPVAVRLGECWANVNEGGSWNAPHSHGGFPWVASYYVRTQADGVHMGGIYFQNPIALGLQFLAEARNRNRARGWRSHHLPRRLPALCRAESNVCAPDQHRHEFSGQANVRLLEAIDDARSPKVAQRGRPFICPRTPECLEKVASPVRRCAASRWTRRARQQQCRRVCRASPGPDASPDWPTARGAAC